jgi:hypothetical protein
MPFELRFTEEAEANLADLAHGNPKKHKKVLACLGKLEANPKRPGLNSHRYESLDTVHGEKVWESYVENQTPGAYRVFRVYGPAPGTLTILAITPHP